jgi:anti-anti-sigma factor
MKKILVIDDEKPTLNMFRLFLGAYGYTVFTSQSGSEGLETFQKEKPAIVLTDIKMPGMDGFEVLKRIKEAEPSTEVIIITGHGDMDLAIQALDLQATDFINKPIQKDSLDAALKRAEKRLRSQSCREENIVSLRYRGQVAIVDIQGDVTLRTETDLNEAYEKIVANQDRKVLLNFEENCSINRGGISVLLQLLSTMKKDSRVAVITGLSTNFRKIFQMVGITKYAAIQEGGEDEIVRSLS